MSEELVRYNVPNPAVLAEQTGSLLEFARQIEIDSREVYSLAGDELRSIKRQAKALDDKRREIVDPLNKAVKSVNDLFRAPLETLKNSETVIKQKMVVYDTEQERIAAEERRKAEEVARKERERLERDAAQREAAARAEAEKAAAAAAKEQDQAKAEQMRREAAERLQREQEQAAALAQAAQVVTAVAPVEFAPKAEGTSIRETWKADVTDLAAFVAHVASHPELVRLLKVDQTALNQQARALKDALNYPGVRVYAEKTIASRAA